jgi:phosphatidylserine synthase
MKTGFLNTLVFSSIIASAYYKNSDYPGIYEGIAVGVGFLMVAFSYLIHHHDLTKKVNQLYLVSCILMVLPAILQKVNVPSQDYQYLFLLFFFMSLLLLYSIFWFEDNAKEYNKKFIFSRIFLFAVGFVLVFIFSPLEFKNKITVAVLTGFLTLLSPNFFFRWKYQNTRNFRFGLIAGVFLFFSLFISAFEKVDGNFIYVSYLNILSFYLVSVPFVKDKILPNWLILRFKNVEKSKRRFRRRERYRYKRAMEQENN